MGMARFSRRFRSVLFLAGFSLLEGGTVRLYNDTPYKLRAVIRANDNTFLGEMVISAMNTSTWTDGFNGLPGSLGAIRSQTPYRVLWYCLDGSSFSTCNMVVTGNSIAASNCEGARQCRSKNLRENDKGNIEPAPPLPVPIPPDQQQQSQQQYQQGQQQKRELEFPSQYPYRQEEQGPNVQYRSEEE